MGDDDLIEALKALAHPLRWRILTALAQGESNVGEIEQVTGIAQPGLSQQLGVLRKADLVTTRKEAKLVFYSLDRGVLGKVHAATALLAPTDAITPRGTSAARPSAPGVANFARLS
ncbi:ArsR/SmtB family transcription factor [Erythrobacter donghaensis]|uniref:ArsR/SmtB family transcription factor n=1 Tax=Erythrobacter donghaensis TaxID=267135 RepID=UPI000A38346C|nr:metalloregulator ArsR/SmtB family transcription factor [Erythrobacter donghaensis]